MHPAIDRKPGVSIAAALRVRRLGRRAYADACVLQEQAARSVQAGGRDQLLFVQHSPVITLGRGTTADQLLFAPGELSERGISVARTDRGGGATYHGPGQIVGYPIVDLRRRGLGIRRYLRCLEAALTTVLGNEGIACDVRPGLTGVWTDAGKVAAIGVAVRRGITRHGFALNVRPDLDAFDHIVPCGLRLPVTSLHDLGWRGRSGALQSALAAAIAEILGPVDNRAPGAAAGIGVAGLPVCPVVAEPFPKAGERGGPDV